MTLRGRLVSLFPLLVLTMSAAALALALVTSCAGWLALVPAVVYFVPPLCFRLHEKISPLREGLHSLEAPGYSPWWGSLQMQNIYHALPALEAILRIVPGCYSAWLRLWGSKIGRNVAWTPRVEISDRSLLEIGDRVIFGHKVALYAHVVDRRPKAKGGSLRLFAKRIRIGDGAFVGAGSRLGPGAEIAAGARLPVLTDVSVNGHFDNRTDSEPNP